MGDTAQKSLRNSTVAISPSDAKRLERFCGKIGITKKDFISLSLDYFIKNGIDPSQHESPTSEVAKITKRIDQFFAFFKKQEQDILRPLYTDFVEFQNRNEKINIAIYNKQKESSEEIAEKIKDLYPLHGKIDAQRKFTAIELARIKNGLENLLQLMDEKNKSGLMGRLFG